MHACPFGNKQRSHCCCCCFHWLCNMKKSEYAHFFYSLSLILFLEVWTYSLINFFDWLASKIQTVFMNILKQKSIVDQILRHIFRIFCNYMIKISYLICRLHWIVSVLNDQSLIILMYCQIVSWGHQWFKIEAHDEMK